MTVDEARDLTARINRAADALWRLLYEAYEREAWKVLGYESWRAYATAELSLSKSHAYRLLDQGRVITAIAEAAGDPISPNGENGGIAASVTEAEARDIKSKLDEVTREVRERVEAGESPADVVPDVVQKHRREKSAPTPGPSPAPDEPEDLGPDPVAEWERAEKENEHLRDVIEGLQADDLSRRYVELQHRYAQLEGRLAVAINTRAEAEKDARYAKGKLAEIRKALGVARDSEIIPAIANLRRAVA